MVAPRALADFRFPADRQLEQLRVEHLELGEHPTVRLHGKGDKWRTCPLWGQTALILDQLLASENPSPPPARAAVFTARGQPLTRYGIYKIVRRHAADLDDPRTGRQVGPHTFRHTAAYTSSKPASRSTSSAAGSGTPTSTPPTTTPRC